MSTDAVRAALAELVACQDELDSTKMSMFVNSTEFARFLERNCERTEAARAAARAALSEPAQSVPDGWQLVPKEPTQAMCMTMPALPPLTASDLQLRGWLPGALMNRKRYLAALAAAPTPQEPTP